jgi:hypothetical protein
MADSSYMQGDPDRQNNAIPFSDDDADEPELSPGASAEEKLTRLQKKTERMNRALQENKAHVAKVKELEEREQKRERELAELRGMVAANNNALMANQPRQPDAYERRLEAIYQRQTEAYNAAQAEIKAGSFTPERQAYYERIARDIESEKMQTHTERAVEARSQRSRAESAQQVWVQKYPEVYNHPRAYQYAQATYQRRKALGEDDTNSLVDEIMTEAMTTFRLGGKAPPSASDRARMSGVPSAGGGGGRASGDISMTPELVRIARAAYPDLPEGEAEKKWKAKTGKRLRERKVI